MEVQTDEELDQLAASLAPYKTFERTYDSEHFGEITYTQYNMKRRRKDME
jgi:hypothetical protein